MIAFAAGLGVFHLAVASWNLAASETLRWCPASLIARILMILCVVPFAMAMSTAIAIQKIRPRRIFDRGGAHAVRQFAVGIFTAVLGSVLTFMTPPILEGVSDQVFRKVDRSDARRGEIIWHRHALPDGEMTDLVEAGLGNISATAVVLLLLTRRRQPGYCIECAYDIRHSLDAGRCPECGTAI